MAKKKNREEIKKEIVDFFENIESKTPKDIKKIKKKAMSINFKLRNLRKKFCKNCYTVFPYNTVRNIKNKNMVIRCRKCRYMSKWKLT